MALALVWLAKLGLRHFGLMASTPLLDLANTLLVAMALIRFFVYVLRSVLPEGGFLRTSERTLAWTMWIGVALYVTGLLPEIGNALDDVGITLGKQRISLLLVIQAVVSVAVTLAVALWLASLIEGRVLRAERMQMSTRVVLAKLVRTVAFFAAILVALPLVGIDITVLSVFGGALGVGLGFGLQKIASNYVSGFIILLDRSVRIGDLVTVDGRHGTVQEIAVALHGGAKRRRHRVDHPQRHAHHAERHQPLVLGPQGSGEGRLVTVAHDADMDARLRDRWRPRGKAHPRALSDPAPAAIITRLGDPGVEVELAVWIDDAQRRPGADPQRPPRGSPGGLPRPGNRAPCPAPRNPPARLHPKQNKHHCNTGC